MNIRKIIGLGLLAAFITCQDTQPPTLPPPACENPSGHTWVNEQGETHETNEVEDEQGQVHQVHKWNNAQGDSHRTDNWVCKNNAYHFKHVWANGRGEVHEVDHVTSEDGKVSNSHKKRLPNGDIVEVDDDEGELTRDPPALPVIPTPPIIPDQASVGVAHSANCASNLKTND